MIRDIMTSNEEVTSNGREMAVLRENFPSCFNADGSFDLVRFSEFLKDKADISQEGYELKFLGKNYARMLASLDTETVIVPDEVHNSLPDNVNSENVYISGDNIDGLKHLLKSYAGGVKCIYIDPPYNTGTDGFVYNDKFEFTAGDLMTKLSIDEEQAGRILDLTKRGSASHSAWLMFIYPRLLLARELLSKDGVIFVSIDNNEYANLKLLCDDVFGESEYVGTLVIRTATDNNPSQINTEHEYMLCYARNKERQEPWYRKSDEAVLIQEQYENLLAQNITVEEIQKRLRKWISDNKSKLLHSSHYNNVDERGVFSSSGNSSNPHPGGYMYDIIHPVTGKPCPKPKNGWRWKEETFLEYANDDEVCWGIDETTQPHIKKRLLTAKDQLKSYIYEDNRAETAFLEDLFGSDGVFDNPKPHNLIKQLLEFVTDDGDVIVDFFSGSATTGNSVMLANDEFNSKRKFILIQLPEDLDKKYKWASKPDKAKLKKTLDFLDSVGRRHFLDEIGQERLIRAAKQIRGEHPETSADLGFKHYTLQEVSRTTVDKMEKFNNGGLVTNTTIYDEFGVGTVLTTWLIRDGYGFINNCGMINLAGYTAYWCDSHLYLINPNLTEDAIEALIERYNSDGGFNP